MKIVVAGLWHLGTVTAACLAAGGHKVIAFDQDQQLIAELNGYQLPVLEPGLDSLIKNSRQANNLHFSSNLNDIIKAEIVWITYDTPVDENDQADIDSVKQKIVTLFPYIATNSLVIISSQLPVGSTRELRDQCAAQFPDKHITFAYSPENLRLGKAIEVFTNPERIVMGMETAADKNRIIELLTSFTNTIIWMSLESAEMTKHALNAFLATSVVFANELACLCEKTGADITDVERGLKSESRIGAKAYLRAGNAFAGGTLARDVSYLIQIAQKTQTSTRLFSAVLDSNYHHKQWTNRKINQLIGNLKHKTIAILGLTYKPDTNTLRRSSAIELCHWLNKNEAKLQAFDPSITHLPVELRDVIQLKKNIHEALQNADLAVISTEWKQFTNLSPQDFLTSMKQPIVIDANGFLSQQLANETSIHYFSVGKKT